MVRSLVEWPFLLLLVVVCASCGVVVLVAGRVARRVPQHGPDLPSGVGELFGIIGAAFGIILAFIIFVQWSANDKIEATIDTETGALASILRYTDAFDPSGLVNHAVFSYRDTVMKVEIPALRAGHIDEAWSTGGKALDELVTTMQGVIPPSASQSFYDLALGHLDTLTEARRARIELSQSDLSVALWWFVIASTIIVLFFVALIRPADSIASILMLSAVAVFFGLTLSLIVSLNYPLNGPLSVSLHPFYTGKLAG